MLNSNTLPKKIFSEYTYDLAMGVIETAFKRPEEEQFDSWVSFLVDLVVDYERENVLQDIWEVWA